MWDIFVSCFMLYFLYFVYARFIKWICTILNCNIPKLGVSEVCIGSRTFFIESWDRGHLISPPLWRLYFHINCLQRKITFLLQWHRRLFLGVQFTINRHWLCDGLVRKFVAFLLWHNYVWHTVQPYMPSFYDDWHFGCCLRILLYARLWDTIWRKYTMALHLALNIRHQVWQVNILIYSTQYDCSINSPSTFSC